MTYTSHSIPPFTACSSWEKEPLLVHFTPRPWLVYDVAWIHNASTAPHLVVHWRPRSVLHMTCWIDHFNVLWSVVHEYLQWFDAMVTNICCTCAKGSMWVQVSSLHANIADVSTSNDCKYPFLNTTIGADDTTIRPYCLIAGCISNYMCWTYACLWGPHFPNAPYVHLLVFDSHPLSFEALVHFTITILNDDPGNQFTMGDLKHWRKESRMNRAYTRVLLSAPSFWQRKVLYTCMRDRPCQKSINSTLTTCWMLGIALHSQPSFVVMTCDPN